MTTSKEKMQTLLYNVDGEAIKVIFELDQSSGKYYVKVEGVEKNYIEYPEPSFIFSEPCFLNNVTLTEYRLFAADKDIKVLDITNIYHMEVLDDFTNDNNIPQLHLPQNVTRIKRTNLLNSVTIISNAHKFQVIEDNAFNADVRIKADGTPNNTIKFSSSDASTLISLGEYAFKGTDITFERAGNIVVMNNLTFIDKGAFRESSGITSLEAKSLINISEEAFYKNKSILDLNISSSKNFGEKAFTDMKLNSITIGEVDKGGYAETYKLNIDDITKFKIYVPTAEAKKYLETQALNNFPMFIDNNKNPITSNNIVIGIWFNTSGKSIAEVLEALEDTSKYTGLIDSTFLNDDKQFNNIYQAFMKNTSIKEVELTLSNNITHLHDRILKLTGANILGCPNGLILDGSKGSNLTYLKLDNVNLTTTGENFYVKNIKSLTSITLPKTLGIIEDNYGFTNLGITTLAIPNSVTYIGVSGLEGNEKLETVYLNNTITKLSNRVFANCKALKFEIPTTILYLGTEFMYGNEATEFMTVPSSVINISENAFSNMGLINLSFENVDSVNHQILTDCKKLKTIYFNTSDTFTLTNTPIFNCVCHVYVNKNYEKLIENTNYDTKPIYVRGDWIDTEGLTTRPDFDENLNLRDVNSLAYNDDKPITTFKGEELYLINPDITELENIRALTTLKKLTIKSDQTHKLDLDAEKLPSSLEYLDIDGYVSNINLDNLTNLIYLGLNIKSPEDFKVSLVGKDKLKVLKINNNCKFDKSIILNPLELILVVDSQETGIDFMNNVIEIYNGNIKVGYFDTNHKNYDTIKTSNKFLDLERRINKSLTPVGVILSNALSINPITDTSLTDLNILGCEYLGYNLNKSGLVNVYTDDILTPTTFNFTKQASESCVLSSSIKYLKLDKNILYTVDETKINYGDFTAQEKDVIIVSDDQANLYHLFRVSNPNIHIDIGETITTIDEVNLCFNSDNVYNLNNTTTLNWGVYGKNINMEADELKVFDYTYPYESKVPPTSFVTKENEPVEACMVTMIVPKLEEFKYTTRNAAYIKYPELVLNMNTLKHVEFGDIADYNLIDEAKNNGVLTSLENLEYVRFGKAIEHFGNGTLDGANMLKEVYIEASNIVIASASVGVSQDVKVYVTDEDVYNTIVDNPDAFIVGLDVDNVILNADIFDTKENPSLDDLIEVCNTGKVGDKVYVGIDDKLMNLYNVIDNGFNSPYVLHANIKTLRVYTDATTSSSYKKFMEKTNLTNVLTLKISGNNVAVYHVGETGVSDATRAVSVKSVDLTNATLTNNVLNENAFKNCYALKRILMNKTAKIMSASVFENCPIETIKNMETGSDTYTTTGEINDENIKINFVNPVYESYTVFDDPEGKIESLGLNLANLSPQYTELHIKITSSTYPNLANLPDTIKSLTISGDLTTLPQKTFNLKSLIILTAVNFTIPDSAFEDVTEFTNLIDNAGRIEKIGNNAFKGTNISEIKLSGLTEVGLYAFANCYSLVNVEMENLTTIKHTQTGSDIEAYTFSGCLNLKTVKLGTADIVDTSFDDCYDLTNLTTQCENIGNEVFKNTDLSIITAPNLKTIGNGTFYNTALTTFECGEVTTIGNETFKNCSLLTTVKCDKCVSLGDGCFRNCLNLTSVELSSVLTHIGNYCFKYCEKLASFDLNGLTIIPISAFEKCNALTIISNYDGVTTILSKAFKDCISLLNTNTEYKFIGLLYVSSEAFSNTPVKIFTAGALESIEKDVFKNCVSLTKVNIPNLKTLVEQSTPEGYFENLTTKEFILGSAHIDAKTFINCTDVESLTTDASIIEQLPQIVVLLSKLKTFVANSITTLVSGTFEGSGVVKVECKNVIEIGTSAITKPTGVFQNCVNLTDVNLEKCQKIGKYDFYRCEKLTTVNLGNCLFVGDYAFENCTSLTGIVFNANCYNIGKNAFKGCSELTTTDTYKTAIVEDSVYENCVKLTSVTVGSNLKEIGNSSFKNTAVTKITIPNTNFKIGTSAFENSELNEIVNMNNITELTGGKNFKGSKLTTFINTNIKIVPVAAFGSCSDLKMVNLPNCVTNKCSYSSCVSIEYLLFLDLDLKSGQMLYDISNVNCEIYVLRNFIVPESITSKSSYKGKVYYNQEAENLETAKEIMNSAAFKDDKHIINFTTNPYTDEFGNNCIGANYTDINQIIDVSAYETETKTNLKYLNLPVTCQEVADYSFNNCSNLIIICAPGLLNVSTNSLNNCNNLKYFIVNSGCSVPTWLPSGCKVIKI